MDAVRKEKQGTPIKAVKHPLFINGGRRQNLCAVTPKYLFVGSLNDTHIQTCISKGIIIYVINY